MRGSRMSGNEREDGVRWGRTRRRYRGGGGRGGSSEHGWSSKILIETKRRTMGEMFEGGEADDEALAQAQALA